MKLIWVPIVLLLVEHQVVLGCGPQGHLDIGLTAQSGGIVTGVWDGDDPQNPLLLDTGVRVWSSAFQINLLDPFFTGKPGFGAVAGSGLPAGSQVGFNILSDLLYWDGAGQVQFGPVPNHEQLRMRFGFQNRYAGTGTGFVTGFNFVTVASDGSVHQHLSLFLLGADGNSTPASQDGVQGTNGVYLIQLEVTNTGGITKSAPVWVVFNNGMTDCLDCVALNDVGAWIANDRPAADFDSDRHVTQADLGMFVSCATGPGISWADPCCQLADLDRDGDVDMVDFAAFQRCWTGPDIVPDPACAD